MVDGGDAVRQSAGMAASAHHRRLSAILHADLNGYVRLMEGAEDRTVDRLKSVRAEVWQSAVEAVGGRIVNIVADSVLAEFGSTVAAVTAAIDIQERMAHFNDVLAEEQRLMFRIGLHLGEVIVDETETIFGDAVNVAARIQLMAKPGGIAVSSAIRDATHAQIDCDFVDGGKHHARNVSRSLQIYHLRRSAVRSGYPIRVAGWSQGVGATVRRPLLWGTAVVASALFAGGYLVLTANTMGSVSMAARNLSAVQLEQALAERRKADALAAEKRELEEQALQRAEMAAKARRQAGIELENARQARQKAERDLARLKSDIEARRKAEDARGEQADQAAVAAQRAVEEAAQRNAEAEAAALREAEEAAMKKAAASTLTKRSVNQTVAVGQREPLEVDVLTGMSKPAATWPRLNVDAEMAEKQLRLGPTDRRRLQMALTSLGFDTRGDDGVFGQHTREMIANWQKAHNQPATGFVTKAQLRILLNDAAMASTGDGPGKAEEEAGIAVEAPAVSPSSLVPNLADGLWRGIYECGRNGNFKPFTLRPEVHLKRGAGTWYAVSPSSTNDHTLGVGISVDGTDVRVTRQSIPSLSSADASKGPLVGVFEGNSIRASNDVCSVVLTRNVSSAHAAREPATAPQSPPSTDRSSMAAADLGAHPLASLDGLWRGTYECGRGGNFKPFSVRPAVHLKNGVGIWYAESPSPTNDHTIGISVSVDGTNVRVLRQSILSWTSANESTALLLGSLEGNSMRASNSVCTMELRRDASPARATLQ